MKKQMIGLCSFLLLIGVAQSESIEVKVTGTQDPKVELGKITFTDSPYGLLIKPELKGLPPGLHGFHLHATADCGDHGNHAGGHYDPEGSNSHKGPYAKGHLGDLPALYVDTSGEASITTLAPRLQTSRLENIAVMIHAGGDNYSDTPALGGGGARIGCGVIRSN